MHSIEAQEEFLNVLTDKGLSPSTIKAYKSVLREFNRFARTCCHTSTLEQLIRAFIDDLKARGLKPQSINRARNVLRLLSLELKSPCNLPEYAQQVPQPVKTLAGYQWSALESVVKCLSCTRDKCIVRLIMETALRPLECCRLSVGDLGHDAEGSFILVRSRCEQRRIPISNDLRVLLVSWLQERDQRECFDSALFITRRGRRLNFYALDQIVRKTGIKAGVNVGAQTLRNTALSCFLSQGTPLEVVNRIAGQSSLRITERYSAI